MQPLSQIEPQDVTLGVGKAKPSPSSKTPAIAQKGMLVDARFSNDHEFSKVEKDFINDET